MRACFRFLLLWVMLLPASRGAESETELYRAATEAFRDKFFDRAEQQLGEWAAKFPSATNLPAAILLQAQARQALRKHDAAIELLRAHAATAGGLADQYVFRLGETLMDKGEYGLAGEEYERLLGQFPTSNLRIAAAYLQAYCLFQLKEHSRVIDLLRPAEGVFQQLAAGRPPDEYACKGALLLGEACLALGRVDEARAAALAAVPPAGRPDLEWERHDLLARVELAGIKPELALPHLTNAVLAAEAGQRLRLKAQSWNLEAEVLRKLNQPSAAVESYEKITALEGLSLDERRLAMLKAVELLSDRGDLTNAIPRLERYLAANTNEPAGDLLRVKAGELWIERFRALQTRPAQNGERAAATNALEQARGHLRTVLSQFTNSVHVGRAWLNLGWSLWEEGAALNLPARIHESEPAFRTAVEKLIRSDDQAVALFKLADVQLFRGQAREALVHYQNVLSNYVDLPRVRNALFDKTYRQLVRVHIELGDFARAENYVQALRTEFPNNPLTEESWYFFGRALARSGQGAAARAVFEEFMRNYPASTLSAEVRYAEARTYLHEAQWELAIQKHEQWLAAFTNHSLRAEVGFQRAVLEDKAGRVTNALGLFTQFAAQSSAHPLAPAAQSWVADFYYEREQWSAAEQNYQRIFQNTNWLRDPLAYEARMMAARTAFRRQGYSDARSYLTNLIADPGCPPGLLPEAWFALGDMFLREPISGSTNALYNFIEGSKVFDFITRQFPSHRLAALAWAKKGDCHFQIASQPEYVESYAEATNAYWNVLMAKQPDVPVAARNQAEVGLGLALEKMAEGKPPAERTAWLERSLNHFLNVVYGAASGQPPDPFYLKVAGREGGRLAEALGKRDAAIELYQRLIREAPALNNIWEARLKALQEPLAARR